MRRAARIRTALILLAAGSALACGAERKPEPKGLASSPDASGPQANRAPVIQSVRLEPRAPLAGERVRASVQVIDPDGDPVTLGYGWRVAGQRIPGGAPELDVPAVAKGESIELTVTASDGGATSAPFRAQVRVGNQPPELRRVTLDPAGGVPPGSPLLAAVEARDPDGDPIRLRYRWQVNGRTVEASGPRFDTAALRRGDDVRVSVVASDGEEESAALVSAPVRVANVPPRILSQPGAPTRDGSFRYRVEVDDPDDKSGLRFRLIAAPEGMHMDPVLGEIVWVPTPSQAGRHEVELAVVDPQGGEGRQRFDLTVREFGPGTAESAANLAP